MKKLFLIINEDRFFLSHRTRIAEMALKDGWDVTLVTKNTGKRGDIERMGFKYIELPVNPTGMNIKEEIKTFRFLYNLYRSNSGAVIHHVGLKNILWGSLAARLANIKGAVYAVSGLGTLFGERGNRFIVQAIQHILKFGLHKKNIAVIFQNHDDEQLFLSRGMVRPQDAYFIKGSGVDLNEYGYCQPYASPVQIVIFTARMLREKGVEDLIEAAELLREKYEHNVEFWLCGGLSDNPNALSEADMSRLTDGKYIKWLGHRTDVKDLLRQSSIMCFPSYYREGVPKSLIEASAIGRPIVTTDSVGCRDTVESGINGILVPVHNPTKLAEALTELLENSQLRKKMGLESRKIAERDYDVNKVAQMHIDIYTRLLIQL